MLTLIPRHPKTLFVAFLPCYIKKVGRSAIYCVQLCCRRLATGGTSGVELAGRVVKVMSYGWKLPHTRKRLTGEYSQGKVKRLPMF